MGATVARNVENNMETAIQGSGTGKEQVLGSKGKGRFTL